MAGLLLLTPVQNVLALAICEICPPNEVDSMNAVLLNLFDTRSSLMGLLKTMIDNEIQKTGLYLLRGLASLEILRNPHRQRHCVVPEQLDVHTIPVCIRQGVWVQLPQVSHPAPRQARHDYAAWPRLRAGPVKGQQGGAQAEQGDCGANHLQIPRDHFILDTRSSFVRLSCLALRAGLTMLQDHPGDMRSYR